MHGDIIKKAIKISGKTQLQIADKIGITKEHLSRILSGEVPDLYLEKIKNCGINVTESENLKKTYVKSNLIPVYDVDFSAGFGINSEFSGNVVGYIDLMGFRSCTAFIFVKGNSMEPKYINGDKIGLEPIESKRIDYGHDYAIVLTDGTKLVKKIRISKDPQKVKLEPINLKEYDAFEVDKNEIYLLFKVHGPIRDGAY